MRRSSNQPRGGSPGIARLDDLARHPDQHIGIPDCCHAVFGGGFDEDRDLAHTKIDRFDALRLGETEERPGHQVLRIARRDIASGPDEEIELVCRAIEGRGRSLAGGH